MSRTVTRRDASARARTIGTVIEVDESGKGKLRVDLEIDWYEGTEQICLYIDPPKKTTPLTKGPHIRSSVRCAWEDCNRLYPLSGRNDKIYCSPDCQDAAKKHREKQRKAGLSILLTLPLTSPTTQ